MKRHAALPHFKHIERVGKVFAEVVKQDVADAPAENHAEHAVGEQIVQHFFGEHGVALFDAPPPQPDKQGEGDDVAEGIPADSERAQLQGDGVELGMDKHGVSLWCGDFKRKFLPNR